MARCKRQVATGDSLHRTTDIERQIRLFMELLMSHGTSDACLLPLPMHSLEPHIQYVLEYRSTPLALRDTTMIGPVY